MKTKKVDRDTKTQVIQFLSNKLLTHYVFPEIAEQIHSNLIRNLECGGYDEITDGEEFALTLTITLQEISKDEHLWVRWHSKPLPEEEGSLLQNKEKLNEFKQKAKLDNYGFHKVERMPGNVGYLDIRYFTRPSWGSGDTAIAAMNFLTNTSALLIDLRKCSGGNPAMVTLVSSYLFDEEPLHLNSLYWRDEDFTQQYWTLPFVPGKRYLKKPVYVLTSGYTFSAGEEFAYNLQKLKRATLVGETTGGGAHPGSPFRLHPHFEAFIPLGRAINPISNDNWEGRGVIPDIPVESKQALTIAHKMALEEIVERNRVSDTAFQDQMLIEAQAALDQLNQG